MTVGRCEMTLGLNAKKTRARIASSDRGEAESFAIRADADAGADRRGFSGACVVGQRNVDRQERLASPTRTAAIPPSETFVATDDER